MICALYKNLIIIIIIIIELNYYFEGVLNLVLLNAWSSQSVLSNGKRP